MWRMHWLKRSTPFAIGFFAFTLCVSAQSASSSGGSNGNTGSQATMNSVTAANSDASIASPSTATGSSNTSSPSSRSDPYSTFDSSNSLSNNLRRGMYDAGPPEMTVIAIDSINQEDCGTWTQVGVHSATVSTVRLEVPGKARGIYQRACSELKKKKLDDAQRDAERAVSEYHDYPAAWVLLGQVYYKTSDMNDAHNACSNATKIDPDYVASYLCLAAVAEHQQDWDLAQTFSDHALQISPLKNAFALYYKAEAAFHKEDLRDAERNALDAVGADTNHQLPETELLLARIYSVMKKSDEATTRVRNYLKFAHQPDGPAAVTAQLAAISQPQQAK